MIRQLASLGIKERLNTYSIQDPNSQPPSERHWSTLLPQVLHDDADPASASRARLPPRLHQLNRVRDGGSDSARSDAA